jgi:hypothetical protein
MGKRTRKLLISACIALVALAVSFQVFIDRWLRPVIKERLETLIVTGSDSLYNFQSDDIDVSFWRSAVTITNLHIKVDSVRYTQREKAGNLPALTVEINLAKGAATDIRLLRLALDKKISIGSILSKNADITLSRHFRKSNKKPENTPDIPLWKLLHPDIRSIKIDRIILNDINLNYSNADSATAFHWKFEHCSASIDDTKIDSISTADTSRILFTKDIAIIFNNVKLQTPDALYAIEAKRIHFSSQKEILVAEDFQLHTALSRQATYRKLGYDKDLFSLQVPKFTLKNFQLPSWINKNSLHIGTLELSRPSVHVYKDRTVKNDSRPKTGKYPHQLLAQAPFTIHVGQVKVSNGVVTYTEKNQKSEKEGKLVFQKLEGTINNITNDEHEIKKNARCVADIRGLFMDQSPLHTIFTFYLDKTGEGLFDLSADMANISAAELNPVTIPLAQTAVKSFDINRFHFFMKGSESKGTGTLSMTYRNLNVELQKINEDHTLKEKKFLSFIINKLVIYPENPMKDKERKATGIIEKRKPAKSFFSLIWKTLFASTKEITIRMGDLKKK